MSRLWFSERRVVLAKVGAVTVIAFVAGLVVRGERDTGATVAPTVVVTSATAAQDQPGPLAVVDGVPSGFARTELGARSAAERFAMAEGGLLEQPAAKVTTTVKAMSADASADGLVADVQARVDAMHDRLAPGTGVTRFEQAVLATKVEAFTADRARVAAWSVGVVARRDAAQPQAGWQTITFELVWERNDWRIWGQTATDGPTPMMNGSPPTTNDQFDMALSGFEPGRSFP